MPQDHANHYINHNYGYNPELAAKRLRTLPASDEAVRTAIKRQADMGVDEFILRPAPKIWTRWIGSPKSRRRSNERPQLETKASVRPCRAMEFLIRHARAGGHPVF